MTAINKSLSFSLIGFVAVANATVIGVLGFSPQAVSTTAIAHLPSTRAAQNSQPMTIMFVGDLMLDRHVRQWMASSGPQYPFARMGTITRAVRSDLLVGNLEGAIGVRRPPVKSIDFAFDPSVAPLLKKFGFDVLSLANNHGLDQGSAGYEDTKAAFDRAGLKFFGHAVKDDLSATTMDVRGRRIALLGYNITDNSLDEKAAAAAIRRAQDEHDLVIIMMHWGVEYDLKHNASQTSLARRLIDYGADAVVGGHPHVVQGIEIYKNKPIVYSLGNFVFDQYFSEDTQQGIAVYLSFSSPYEVGGGVGGGSNAYRSKTTLTIVPIQSVQSQPRRMEGETARKFLSALLGRSTISKDLIAGSINSLIHGLNRGELVLTW